MRIKKKYKCIFCNEKSTGGKWDQATNERFGSGEGDIEDVVGNSKLGSVCPVCGKINLGNEIEVIKKEIDNLSIFDYQKREEC